MPLIGVTQASYQVVKLTVPNKASDPGIEVMTQFEAPPGFRLHTVERLKDTTLVGQPHQVIMVFEHLAQVVQEVGEDHPAVVAHKLANPEPQPNPEPMPEPAGNA